VHNHFIPTKVRKGKEVSNYSQNDLSAIFGFQENRNERDDPQKKSEVTAEKVELLTTSKIPINLYFTQKLDSKNEKDVDQPNTQKSNKKRSRSEEFYDKRRKSK